MAMLPRWRENGSSSPLTSSVFQDRVRQRRAEAQGEVDAYGESSKADPERSLDAVDLTVCIDGEAVDDPVRHWGAFERNDEGNWIVWWSYVTPPKSPGLHGFEVVFAYPDGYTDADLVIEPGHRRAWAGYYEVVAGRGR